MARRNWHWELFQLFVKLVAAGIVCCSAVVVAAYRADAREQAPGAVAMPSRDGLAGYDELLVALRGAGAIVRPSVEFSQPFFTGRGQVAQVEDVQVWVVEYSDEQSRAAESQLISADGNAIGSMPVTWTDQPNFWASGRVIVLYLGQDQRIIRLLTNALGSPITAYGPTQAIGRR